MASGFFFSKEDRQGGRPNGARGLSMPAGALRAGSQEAAHRISPSAQPSGGEKPTVLSSFGVSTPMGRPCQPTELAPIYVLLASNNSSYCTGQIYGATGGAGL